MKRLIITKNDHERTLCNNDKDFLVLTDANRLIVNESKANHLSVLHKNINLRVVYRDSSSSRVEGNRVDDDRVDNSRVDVME